MGQELFASELGSSSGGRRRKCGAFFIFFLFLVCVCVFLLILFFLGGAPFLGGCVSYVFFFCISMFLLWA